MLPRIHDLFAADDAIDDATEEIGESASSIWDSTLDAVPRVGVAVVVIGVGWVLSRLVRWGLNRWWSRSRTPSFARVMSKVVGWTVLIVVILLAIAITFPSVRPVDILAGLGFFSVAVGFAFQDILENTLSGILLLFRQPFTSGDQIEVVDKAGTVEGITIRETRIRGYDGDLVVIPNRDVYKNVIVVSTETPRHRQEFVVGVDYETDLPATTALIVDAVMSVDGVIEEPRPHALVGDLNVSTVDIDVRFWTDSRRAEILDVRDRAITAVLEALDAAGVQLPADILEITSRD